MSYRSIAFQELIVVLHFTPDAFNHLKGKSIDKKATFVIKPTSGLGARQLIVRSAKVKHRSNQAILLKYPLPFIPSRVTLSSNVIGLKTQYFLLIRSLSCSNTPYSKMAANKLFFCLHVN